MQKEKIEHLREIINKMISSNDYDYEILLEKSQELDKLILEAVREAFPDGSMLCEEIINKGNNTTWSKSINLIVPFPASLKSMKEIF